MATFKIEGKEIKMKDKATVGDIKKFNKNMSAKGITDDFEMGVESIYALVINKEEVTMKFINDMDMRDFKELSDHANSVMQVKKK